MRKAFFVILASIALISCVKEGPRGQRGPQGISGKDGKDGKDAQINTYYFEISPNQWRTNGSFGQQGYYCFAERSLAALTPSVIDEGAVLAYVLLEEQGVEYDHQLPYVKPSDFGGYLYLTVVRYDLQVGTIGFIVEDSDFQTPLPPFGNRTLMFKVVVISKS